MSFIGLYSFNSFGNIRTDTDSSGTEGEVMLTYEFDNFSNFCGPCVGYIENKNVTDTQKELII